MSLIHWWPLNGNTTDYGINSLALINNGATVNSAGKIGKCYSFSNNNMVVATSDIMSATELSLCLWLKLSTSHSGYAQVLVLGTSGTSWNNIRCGIDINGDGRIYFNVSSGSANTLIYSPLNYKDNIWHHVTCIYNNGSLQLYIDGIQVAAGTTTNVPGLSGTSIYVGGNAGGEKANNGDCLNDVRIYDHALSVKEVKEISKGLVLHYNFEDEYIEPTTNIDPARDNLNNNSASISGMGSSGSTTVSIVNFTGFKCYKIEINKDNISSWFGVYLNSNPISQGAAVGDTVTRSVMMYIPSGQTLPGHFTESIEGNSTNKKYVQYNYSRPNTWQKVSLTGTIADTGSNNYLHYLCAVSSGSVHLTIYLRDFQMEIKDHATPYVNGTRSAGKVYDNSGYGNNGTVNGNLQISSNSISGQYSGKFDGVGTTYIYETTTPQYTKNITFNVWCYQESASSPQSEQYIFSQGRDNDPSGFNIISSSGIAQIHGVFGTVSSGISIVGNWHMITGTYDGTTVKCYVDGILKKSLAYTSDLTYTYAPAVTLGKMAFDYTNSGYYFMFNGKIADAKIYATALSEDDVKAEYNRKAAIDRNGNLFTGELVETTYNLLTSENLLNGRVNTSATSNVGEIVTRNNYSAYRISPVAYWSGDGATSKNICKGQFGSGQYIFDLWIDVDDVYYDGNGRWVPGGFEVYYTDGSVENVIVDANSTQGHSGYQHLISKTNANKTISGLGVYYYIDVPIYIRCDSVICKVNSDGKICKNNIIAGGQFVEPAVSDSKCKLTRYGVVSNAIKEL